MSQIEITGSSSRRSSTSREVRAGLGQRRLNVIVAWLLVLLVGLAPLPFASVRPAFSALWAIYVGLIGLVYFGLLIQRGERLRFDLARVRLPAILLGLASAALLVQLLPIFGSSIALPDGSAIDISQLTIAPGLTALMLCRQPSFRVHMLGGEIDPGEEATKGVDALEAIGRYRVDIGFLGGGGLSADGEITDFTRDGAEQRSRVIASATESYFVLDSSKFGRLTPMRIPQFGSASGVVVDRMPPPAVVQALEDKGLRVISCDIM